MRINSLSKSFACSCFPFTLFVFVLFCVKAGAISSRMSLSLSVSV